MTVQDHEAPPSDLSDALTEEWRRAQAEIGAIGQSIGSIGEELAILVMRERELARAELADAVAAATTVGIWGAIAGIAGLIAVAFMCVAVMLGLATVLPPWGAALVTALLLSVIAIAVAIAMKQGLAELHIMPVRTIRSLREDATWAVRRIKRNAA